MPTRVPYWSEEQLKIQAKFDAEDAKEHAERLTERISSLEAQGRISKKDSAQMKKSLIEMMKKIEKAGK